MDKLQKNTSISEIQFGKIPPQARDLEEAVLGALMIDKTSIGDVIEIMDANNFYVNSNQLIAEAIISLYNDMEPIDILTVVERLNKLGTLEKAGGAYRLTQLTNRVASAANAEYHCRIINQKAYRRRLIEQSLKNVEMAYDETVDVFDLLDTAETNIMGINSSATSATYKPIADINTQVIAQSIHAKNNEGHLIGVPSGYYDLDRKTGGWKKTDLIIVAARPAMGKTSFVINMGLNAAKQGKKVAIFSLEMSSGQLATKIISIDAEIQTNVISEGKWNELDFRRIEGNVSEINKLGIYICDKPAININELRTMARQIKSKYGLDELIVDYLQLMSGVDKKNKNREQEISDISRGLKSLAKEMDIPVIALSQLSRDVEKRGGDKRPMLSDIRDSGGIEQDADMVVFLYRPEYYGMIDYEDENGRTIDISGLVEVIIAKFRQGSTGVVKLKFIKKFTKFIDWSEHSDIPF